MYGEEIITVITALEAIGIFMGISVRVLVRYWKSLKEA